MKDIRGPQSIKDVRSRAGGCPVRTFCWQGEFFRCGRPHFLVQKI